MWKTKGDIIIDNPSHKRLRERLEILRSIDVDNDENDNTIELPGTSHTLTTVGCFLIEVIAVTLDKSLSGPIPSRVDQDSRVRDLIIRAENRGFFTELISVT